MATIDDDLINDIKQMVAAVVAQQAASLETCLVSRFDMLDTKIDTLDTKINVLRADMMDGFAGIAEIFDYMNERLDEQYDQLSAAQCK